MVVQRKKILQLITSIQLGGAEIVAFNIAEACQEQHPSEFEFIITELFASKTPYAEEKRKDLFSKNIRIKTLTKRSKRLSLIFAPWYLFLFLLREKPQIIHSHTDLPDFVLAATIKLLNLFRIKYGHIVRTIHNTALWPTHNQLGKFTESTIQNDYIIGVSEASLYTYRQLRQKYKLPESTHQQVIYNGCYTPIKEQVSFPINNEKINIAFCGRFEYQKGLDILIDRIKELNLIFQDQIQFYLIGEGKFSPMVKELVNQSENVIHYPPIHNIANKLYVFDFLIMPSRFEGLVLLSLEASFARVPVIAAVAPGLTETLPSDWPLFFKLDDKRSLILIIEKIVKGEFDIIGLKNQAEKFVLEKFSIKKMGYAYSQCYSKMVLS
jgi:glycosyltransferase involved in cell wall biosynthesis